MQSPDVPLQLSEEENTAHKGQYKVTFKPGLDKEKDKEASVLLKLQGPTMTFENPYVKSFLQ